VETFETLKQCITDSSTKVLYVYVPSDQRMLNPSAFSGTDPLRATCKALLRQRVTRQVRSFSAPSTRYMIDLRAVWQNLRADRIRESWFIEHNNEGSGTQCCTTKNPTVLTWSCLRDLHTPIDSIDAEYVCGDFVSLRIVKIPK